VGQGCGLSRIIFNIYGEKSIDVTKGKYSKKYKSTWRKISILCFANEVAISQE
jgi:hypothetical protein